MFRLRNHAQDAGTDIDVHGGYSHALGKNSVTIDGGLYGYIHPGSARAVVIDESYYEAHGDVSTAFGPITAKSGADFTPNQSRFKDFATATRHNVHVFGELAVSLPNSPSSLHTMSVTPAAASITPRRT